ncbi:glycine--tRNA ligase [Natronomonas sp. CBA1123]|uniref:glycine--tRNA ligase n=1 Tax=Natronomonas sp. CBA1123 TaxID=2668070 RepID=UPI0012EAC7F7|nr:glycine--tRNA ligase [Natronomonas sp. CBA1123]MUV85828.1 glycine--tRNA ligase [Natronomonas sp. CBA1123]
MTELDDLAELAKRRGFFFPSNEAYGGTAGFYTYGPEGAALKRNLEDTWRDIFVREEGHMELEAPTVMPEAVFEASGHLDGFDDMIIECVECGATHRADHLVEDAVEDIEDAEAYEPEEVAELIADHGIECPSCGASLADTDVEEFNLMFGTNIGPGSSSPGYLRPETAQGIFVEFPRLKEYARNQLPFGVAQIGRAYRNEISPRRALVRVREFTQAELEHFIDPETDDPPLERVADVEVPLYSAESQNADDGGVETYTVGEAVEEGVIGSEWVAYYLGRAMDFYERIGIDMDRFRYRQHLSGERAHYAADCWDAETELGGNWVEVTGFAYRSDYDLSKHGEYSGEDFTLFRQYDEPKTVERATVDPDMSYLGPEFGGAAGDVADALESLAGRDRSAFDGEEVTVEVDGESYTVPVEKTGFSVEEQTEAGEHITPHVVEPSFGVGRLVYSVLIHRHGTDEVDGEQRAFLDLPADIAPTTVAVFPLMTKDGLDDRAEELAHELRENGFEVAYDDTGNIGRRYRRQDEVGTPYCVTVDYETLEDGTVTVRERDSTDQTRVAVDELPGALRQLVGGATLSEL